MMMMVMMMIECSNVTCDLHLTRVHTGQGKLDLYEPCLTVDVFQRRCCLSLVCSAAEDAVTAATTAEHLQRVHSADGAAAVLRSLLVSRLSQDSVRAPITTKVTNSLTDLIIIILSNIQCVSKKNIPDIFSYNSRKHCRIFIIFGTRITEKLGNQ